MIRVYDAAGNVIETLENAGDFKDREPEVQRTSRGSDCERPGIKRGLTQPVLCLACEMQEHDRRFLLVLPIPEKNLCSAWRCCGANCAAKFWFCPTAHDSPPLGVSSVIYGLRCTVKLASLRSLMERSSCKKILTLPRVVGKLSTCHR